MQSQNPDYLHATPLTYINKDSSVQPKTKDYLHATPSTYINQTSNVQIEKPDKEAFDIWMRSIKP
ncbi:MAG: hypothetical protein ICV54_30175 [Nostoc sp. C3-bin3]|nr:hypothetical protein [Nostoc sp. C3-bin3]